MIQSDWQYMSWIDKEIKKRAAKSKPTTAVQSSPAPGAAAEVDPGPGRMAELWGRMRGFNEALPAPLQLALDKSRAAVASAEDASVSEWLRAPGGAAMGFAGNAIRYTWPERSQRRSRNFWIRWSGPKNGYIVNQRISAAVPPAVAEFGFDDGKAEYMIKCLVLGRRIKPRSVRKRRFWIF